MRLVVAFILLIAAILKAYKLATTPPLGEGLLYARWFNIFIVEFELFFGIWLVFGLLPRLTWIATIGLFSIFSIVSFYKVISGEISCGCFGSVTVNPWITMIFDLMITGLLMFFLPKKNIFRPKILCEELTALRHKSRIIAVIVIWLVTAIPITLAMFSIQENNIADIGTEFVGADGKKTILLKPEKWIGKEFPLLPYIEPTETREKLKTGKWMVVLYHHDCPRCHKAISELIEKKTENLLCVEMPPYGTNKYPRLLEKHTKLSDIHEWSVETPIQFFIINSKTFKKD
jgi:hypothetical protein